MEVNNSSYKIITVYCGVCGAMFSSWETYDLHYKQEHLKVYGPSAFGVHPRIEVYDSSEQTVKEDVVTSSQLGFKVNER